MLHGIPVVVAAPVRALADLLAHLVRLDEVLDPEEVVLPERALDVVHHPLGAGAEGVAELLLRVGRDRVEPGRGQEGGAGGCEGVAV